VGALRSHALLSEGDVATLSARLSVTLRGISLDPARPRAVIAVPGDHARALAIAEVVARDLFGDARRMYTADLARVISLGDLYSLLGGRGTQRSATDSVIQRACRGGGGVLVLKGFDSASETVRQIFTEALRTGTLLDAAGQELRLGATVVVLSTGRKSSVRIGFSESTEAVERPADPDLDDVVDVVAGAVPAATDTGAKLEWLQTVAAPWLTDVLSERGLEVHATAEVLEWLHQFLGNSRSLADLRRIVENRLLPALVRADGARPWSPGPGPGAAVKGGK
jgi:hypothetical protein